MTVTYSLEVSSTRLGGFAKLLLRWKGSIYRLVYREMIIFTLLYYAVAILYRFVLPEAQKRAFEDLARYCREFTDLIPITFVMGFYVAVVVGRWWNQYMAIPWPDRCCLQIATYVEGNDERGRMIRRGLARYLNLLSVLTMQATSTVIRKRFPSVDHIFQSGLMTEEEKQELDETVAPHGNWWIPASWFCQLAMQARKEGRIHDDLHLKSIIDDALTFRGNCGLMWSFDWISVPLVYTQVVTLAVYCFFLACLFGRQYLEKELASPIDKGFFSPSYAVDYYVPVFTFFQFFFYMGWLKVAEQLINPYGEDDDDFELSWIIDRNLQVSYSIVDGLYQRYPKMERDAFWDKVAPDLPYTEAAMNFKTDPFLGSTMTMNMTMKEKGWHVNPIPEEARAIRSKINRLAAFSSSASRSPADEGRSEPKLVSSLRTPRGRKQFLASLLNGESRSSLNSHCGGGGSKASLNSISTASRQKSPTPASPKPESSIVIIGDPSITAASPPPPLPRTADVDLVFPNWRCPPQRQWSLTEANNGGVLGSFVPLTTVHSSDGQTTAIAIGPEPMTAVHPSADSHQHRRVTFEAAPPPSLGFHSTDVPLRLLRSSASEGTLISDGSGGGHDGAGSAQFVDENEQLANSDSEQFTINSRTLLLNKSKQ